MCTIDDDNDTRKTFVEALFNGSATQQFTRYGFDKLFTENEQSRRGNETKKRDGRNKTSSY